MMMSRSAAISRRVLLAGGRRSRRETPPASEIPETAPEVPDWECSLERVLEQMNDLTGIEER